MAFDVTRYTAAVFDLDGTVWLSEIPIPGAARVRRALPCEWTHHHVRHERHADHR